MHNFGCIIEYNLSYIRTGSYPDKNIRQTTFVSKKKNTKCKFVQTLACTYDTW